MNNLNSLNELRSINKNQKRKGWKFWLLFWLLSACLLTGWFFFLEYKKNGWFGVINILSPALEITPIGEKKKAELQSIFKIASVLSETKETQTFLILFQNNLELRPGGGFIGSFGILKIKEGKVTEIDVHDTNVFDSRIATGIEPPYPMKETLNIKNWEMRDSNWSPDFTSNAKKAVELYKLQGGGEDFNGVIAVSTDILNSFLEVVGPVQLEGFPGEYNSENAITKLEYQVEKGYLEQNIEKGKRKYIMKYLAKEIIKKAESLGIYEKKNLLLKIEEDLDQKDIMINFINPELQKEIARLNWDGEVIIDNDSDYLMMIDANLAAYKTDLHMVRSFKYRVDFSFEEPLANLEITYRNTARAKDWMTNDYQSYLRVYTPANSWLIDSSSSRPVKFGEEFNKKFFGTLVQIPINQTRRFSFNYKLSEDIDFEDYNLIIQKQSGVSEIKGELEIISPEKEITKKSIILTQDWELNSAN